VVPQYYLHIHNRLGNALDEEGLDLDNLETARARAIEGIRSFLSSEVLEGKLDLRGHLDIAQDDGVVLDRIAFDEAVLVYAK
jgi:hypothetical protein